MRSPAGSAVEVEAGFARVGDAERRQQAPARDGLGAQRGELGGDHPADATRRRPGTVRAPVASIESQNVVSQSR